MPLGYLYLHTHTRPNKLPPPRPAGGPCTAGSALTSSLTAAPSGSLGPSDVSCASSTSLRRRHVTLVQAPACPHPAFCVPLLPGLALFRALRRRQSSRGAGRADGTLRPASLFPLLPAPRCPWINDANHAHALPWRCGCSAPPASADPSGTCGRPHWAPAAHSGLLRRKHFHVRSLQSPRLTPVRARGARPKTC